MTMKTMTEELQALAEMDGVELYQEAMDSKQKKALKSASNELGKTEDEVLKMWNDDKPHFGGGRPHRYDGGDDECSYCLRPKDWK